MGVGGACHPGGQGDVTPRWGGVAGMWEVKPRRSVAVGERCVVTPGRLRGGWDVGGQA